MAERILSLVEPESGATAVAVVYDVEDDAHLYGRVVRIEPREIDPEDSLPDAVREAIYANEFQVATAGGHIVDDLERYYDGVYFALRKLAEFEGLELQADPPDLSRSDAYRSGGVM